MANKNLLQNIYLFKGLSGPELELISEAADIETYSSNDEIFNQGDKSFALYVIKYGSVRIHQRSSTGDHIEVATLGTGSHFGEMGFVDGEVRSASATAMEKSDIVVFDYEKLRNLMKENLPIAVRFYQELSHFLCGRLRITTNDLSFSREKNLSHF
jgi:CRP/FNR family transcriptional regulator, cyclic AMP receptor protein